MKKATTIFLSVALFALASVGTLFASTISKTFEFGPGMQYSSSVFRTFSVPCGLQVLADVKFKRQGPAGTSNDIPIKIEFREPETAPNQEGPIIATKSAQAILTEQSVSISSAIGGSSRGCTLPWRVRVKHANAGTPPFAVTGTAFLHYDGSVRNTGGFSNNIGSILKSASKTINVGSIQGLSQGKIEIWGSWSHEIFGIIAPSSIGFGEPMLRFELIDPTGTVVKTAQGFDDNYKTDSPMMLLIHQVPICVSGQWKLKITNTNNKDDAGGIFPHVILTPGCP